MLTEVPFEGFCAAAKKIRCRKRYSSRGVYENARVRISDLKRLDGSFAKNDVVSERFSILKAILFICFIIHLCR